MARSFDWLVSLFKAHQKWKEIDHKRRRLYGQGLVLLANHKLKDNARTGPKPRASPLRKRRDGSGVGRAWFVGQRASRKEGAGDQLISHKGPTLRVDLCAKHQLRRGKNSSRSE